MLELHIQNTNECTAWWGSLENLPIQRESLHPDPAMCPVGLGPRVARTPGHFFKRSRKLIFKNVNPLNLKMLVTKTVQHIILEKEKESHVQLTDCRGATSALLHLFP